MKPIIDQVEALERAHQNEVRWYLRGYYQALSELSKIPNITKDHIEGLADVKRAHMRHLGVRFHGDAR